MISFRDAESLELSVPQLPKRKCRSLLVYTSARHALFDFIVPSPISNPEE